MASADTMSRQLAELVCDVPVSSFPPATLHKAKLHILDTLGVALAGSASIETQTVLAALGLQRDVGRSVIWGTTFSVNPRAASFMNGVSAHAFELDDSGGCDHSGAVVIPAALAILPELPHAVSGSQFLSAVLMGYEVGRRVLEASGGYEAHNGLGWHSTGTCGVFGAATAAALLLGMSATQLTDALGIACSFAGGTWSFIHDGSQTKKLHPGRAAEGGVIAALLAQGAFRGPAQALDGDSWGSFFKTFAPDIGDPALLIADFGAAWRLDRCSIKPYATCRGTHSAIDAVRNLLRQHRLSAPMIAGVEARMSAFQFGMCGGRTVSTRAEAQMSLPYAVAAELEFGKVGLAELEPAAWSSPAIGGWLGRIAAHGDPDMRDEDEPIITVIDQHGHRHTETVPFPYGSPSNPLPDDQLIGKYFDLSAGILPRSRLDAIAELVLGLEASPDMRALPKLLQSDGNNPSIGATQ